MCILTVSLSAPLGKRFDGVDDLLGITIVMDNPELVMLYIDIKFHYCYTHYHTIGKIGKLLTTVSIHSCCMCADLS